MARTLLEGATATLEEGDQAINFVAVNQNYRKTSLESLIAQGPILLFTSWSRNSNLRDQYFTAFKQFEGLLTSKGHRIVFLGAETFTQCKEDQAKYGLESCIFLDDVSENRFQISHTYFGENPEKVRNICCAIEPNGLIRYKQHYPEAYNFEFFFKIVAEYIQGEY